VLSVLKLAVIALVLLDTDPWPWLGMVTPAFWTWMRGHRMYACFMIFFISNAIESQLLSTGAFEMSFNDVPVWSKLATGRIPTPPELFQILDNHALLKTDIDALQY